MNDSEKEISYIYSYIKYTFFSVKEFENEKFLLDMSRRIKNSMPNSVFSSSKYDFVINNFVSKEMKARKSNSYFSYEEIRNHIYLLVEYCRLYSSNSIENTNNLLTEAMKYAVNNFKYDEIASGLVDEKIEDRIMKGFDKKFVPLDSIPNISLNISNISYKDGSVIDDRFFVSEYVYERLNSLSKFFSFKGDLDYLANLITTDLFNMEISYESILNHEYDDLIDSYVRTNKYGIELNQSFIQIESEISNFIQNKNTYMEVGSQYENMSKEIFKLSKYLLEEGYSLEDIRSGKCNSIMENHMRTDCIIANSKECNVKNSAKNPNKFVSKCRKAINSPRNRAAVLIATAAILGASFVSQKIDTNKSVKAYENFDTYEYQTSYSSDDAFFSNLEHILNNYDNYNGYGEEYGQICLYKAYEAMSVREFYGMDVLFSHISARTKYGDYKSLGEEISGSISYVDYVYNKLLEIDSSFKDKYERAVNAYNAQVANYRELSPYTVLESKDKTSAKALKKMMEDYKKYIEDLELQMGKDIREEKKR